MRRQADNRTILETGYSARDNAKAWRKHSAESRQRLDISVSYDGYTSRPDVKLVGVSNTVRCRDTLNINWAFKLQSMTGASSELRAGMWSDLSQNVQRGTTFRPGTLCTSG